MIRLVAIDMDGTLLRPDGHISERNVRALKGLKAMGAEFLICTGRSYIDALEPLKAVSYTHLHDQVEAMTLGTRIVVMNQGMIQQVAPPAELYRNPVNKFVAGFIGSPTMNFLDVDVLEEDGTVWLLGQGWRLPLEGYQARKLKEKGFAGKRVTLGIRPEDLHQEECSRKNGSDGLNGNDSGWIGV